MCGGGGGGGVCVVGGGVWAGSRARGRPTAERGAAVGRTANPHMQQHGACARAEVLAAMQSCRLCISIGFSDVAKARRQTINPYLQHEPCVFLEDR